MHGIVTKTVHNSAKGWLGSRSRRWVGRGPGVVEIKEWVGGPGVVEVKGCWGQGVESRGEGGGSKE